MKKLVACLLALAAGPALVAADVCPKPPAWGQVPDYWSPLAGGNPRGQLAARYDGRWAGAAQVPLDEGSSSARVRFLDGNDGHLYVAFEVDATAYDREVFWLGFTSATATDSNGATLIEISVRPDPNAPQPPPPDEQVVDQAAVRCGAATCPGGTCTQTACGPTPLVSYRFLHGVAPTTPGTSRFLWDNVAFDATVLARSWMEPSGGQGGARAWHGPLYPPPSSSGQPTGATVMLRVPHAAFGAPTAVDRKFWVAAATCQFLGQGPGSGLSVCASQGYWPTAGAIIQDPNDANAYQGPAVLDWALLRRTTACPTQPELVAAGVQNDPAGYDVNKPFTWPQRMYLDNDGDLTNDPPNWFGARLAFPIQSVAGKYRARFFIADWGSQIGSLDVAQWFEIGQVTNPGTTTAPATEHLVLRWPPASMTAAEVKDLACKYSDCDSSVPGCPYPSDTMAGACAANTRLHHPHQCTMIRLEAIGATSSYQFARDSQIFNTDFVGASVFWRVATISTAGIENERTPAPLPSPPEGRDLYIYVRPANLPEHSTEIPAEKTVERLEAVAGAVVAAAPIPAGVRPPPEVTWGKQLREQLGRRDGQGEMPRERQDSTIKRVRTLPMNTVRLVAPALEFFVYYDTGRVMDTHPGYTSRWLAPMTGFGYIAEHIGEIQGWAWALDGAEPLGGNWFRVRVADGQRRKVRTRIQAVDETRMPPGNPSWPPGPAWINTTGVPPTAVTVKVSKSGGCSTTGADGAGGGAAATGGLLALAGLLATRRRDATPRR